MAGAQLWRPLVHYEGWRWRTGLLDSVSVSNEWEEPVSEQENASWEQKAPSHTKPKNSGLGIASFVTSIIASVLTFVTFAVAGVLQTSKFGGMEYQEAPLVGLAAIGLVLVHLVAVGLGIAGLFQKETKKTFAILGTVFSSGAIVIMVLTMIIGANLE